jgi:hypothetical protein
MELKEKYQILIEARNFHYDNFNKWMTYFYVAVGTIFIGYTTVISSQKDLIMVEWLLLLLGYITGLLWYWSCKGYYYWNINFISLVNYYETELFKWSKKERIYSVFANKSTENDYVSPISGANISSSKVAILFAFIITCFWGFILSYKLLNNIICFCDCKAFIYISSLFTSTISTLIFSVLVPKSFLKSKIDHFPDLGIKQKKND